MIIISNMGIDINAKLLYGINITKREIVKKLRNDSNKDIHIYELWTETEETDELELKLVSKYLYSPSIYETIEAKFYVGHEFGNWKNECILNEIQTFDFQQADKEIKLFCETYGFTYTKPILQKYVNVY